MTLADRQVSANRLADAEATLRILYAQDPMDTETFGRLVKVLGDENKNEALIDLYKSALDTVAKSNLDRDTATQRLREVRLGMVATMAKLQRPSDAVDQYIEVINRQPEDVDILNNAVAFAERNNQLDRLVKYYSDTSQKSFKDYRWNLVLARIAEHKGDYATSIPQYQNAVQNEPQRLDFRSTLADAYIRTNQFDQAIAELRRGRDLDQGNTEWLTRIALVQVQQGKRADAVATLRLAMNSSKNSLSASVFTYADKLKQWGLSKEALEFYDEGLKRYLKNPYEQNLTVETLNGLIEVSLKNEAPVNTAQRLETLIATLQKEQAKETNYEKYKIDAGIRQTYTAIEDAFAKDIAAFGNADQLQPLAEFYKRGITQTNGYDDNAQKHLRHFVTFGHNSLLPDVEEAGLMKLKDAAYGIYKTNQAKDAANVTQSAPPTNQPARNSRTPQTLNRRANETIGSAVDSQHYYSELVNLLNFYDSRAAFDKSAQLLESMYQQDPVKDKFDYFREIAWRYEMSGEYDREQSALKKYFDSRAGDLSALDDPAVGRYLELVYSLGHPQNMAISDNGITQTSATAPTPLNPAAQATLRDIASRYNPYQLQVINFFIDHSEEVLAQEAITHTNLSAAWVASRSAQVALYFKDQSSKSEGFFRVALDLKNIGDTIKGGKVAADGLTQHDWLWTSRSYGMWLNLNPARGNESRRYITGLIERRPRDLEAQLQLAKFYLDAKQTKRAAEHIALSEELSSHEPRVLAVKGSILFADGKANDAIAVWNSIALRKGATQNDLEIYFNVMRDHKMARQALSQVESYLAAHVTKSDELEALKPFIRDLAFSAYTDESEKVYRIAQSIGTPQPLANTLDTQTATAVTTMFRNVTQKLPDNLLFPEMILNEHLISDVDRGEFYRIVISREENKILALLSSGENPDKYSEYNGGEYVHPVDSLNQWREQYLNYLIDHKSYAQARTELGRIRTLEAARKKDNYSATDDDDSSSSALLGGKDWSIIVEARLNIREGKSAEALTDLKRFVSLGTAASESGLAAQPNRERAVAAATMLRREGKSDVADQLMRDVYSQMIAAGQMDAANFAGLAELEFKTGGNDRALALLKRMVDAHIGDEVTIKLAAAIAARYQSYTAALAYRQKAQTLNPEDAENRLETARVMAALNQRSDAADLLAAVAEDRTASNTAKAAATLLIAEVAKADPATMTRLTDTYRQKASNGGFYAKLILAQLQDAAGQVGQAEQTLQSAAAQPYSGVASLMLGGLESRHGNAPAAAKAFETYIYHDPDGLISDAVVFGVARPREQLISYYATHNRRSAAIQIANQSDQYRRSTQQGDDEGLVFYSQDNEPSILSSQPGGWFIEVYLYPLYSVPNSNLFRIPPGHGPVRTAQSATEIEDAAAAKFRTIAELNLESSLQGRRSVLRLLSQVSASAGDFQAAVDYERARRPLLTSTQSIDESTTYLVSLIGKQREAEKKIIAKAHVNKAFTDETAEESTQGQ
jgi:tetratricopeptide (TPR) repeat protein